MSWKTPLARKLARAATARPGVLSQLLRQPELLEAISGDDALLAQLLKRSESARPKERPAWFDAKGFARRLTQDELHSELIRRLHKKELDVEILFEGLIAAGLLEAVGPEPLLNHLSDKQILEHLGHEKLLGHLSARDLLDHVGIEKAMRHFGAPALLERLPKREIAAALPPEKALQYMGFDVLFDTLAAQKGGLPDALASRAELLKALFRDERILKSILAAREFRDRLAVARAHETAGRLNWPYPAVVCSYPRAGSNFLQSILMQSSGMNNVSIYGRKDLFKPSECVLTVKSHAPSPAYLEEEFARKVEWPERPDRVVLLQRDPRDVMISFFEYTQANRKITLDQAQFLDSVDYFYASTIDTESQRTMYTASLTVAAAFREHVRAWFVERPPELKCLVVRYEDLVENAEAGFQRIFDFLEVDCTLAREFLGVKVSLYSEGKRARGVAGGWRQAQETYQVLIDGVNAKLAEEIQILGYELAAGDGPADVPAQP
jgi:hypothetical protein